MREVSGGGRWMYYSFAKVSEPMGTAVVALESVYSIGADMTYNYRNPDRDRNALVALRTIGGRGMVSVDEYGDISLESDTLVIFEVSRLERFACKEPIWKIWWYEFLLGGTLPMPQNRVLKVEQSASEADLHNSCLELLRNNDTASRTLASATFNYLLHHWGFMLKSIWGQTDTHQDSVRQVMNYIYSNLDRRTTVKEMAAMVGLSERRFRDVFRKLTGQPPKRHIATLKMNMAAEFLTHTSATIGDIACKLGYDNQFHFSKAFRKYYGISPSAYRSRSNADYSCR